MFVLFGVIQTFLFPLLFLCWETGGNLFGVLSGDGNKHGKENGENLSLKRLWDVTNTEK